LRAVAVLSVLLFHFGVVPFSGGFVGVDLFFVISGFLITHIITDELRETGRFSFLNFYNRRARRLMPALLFTVLFAFVFAGLLFSPDYFKRFGAEAFHALLWISNFFFWQGRGYFDAQEAFKPLLHTWSLSVEEQFYVGWPILLVLLALKLPRVKILYVVLAGGILSLGLNLVFIESVSAIFYLVPFRAFEFAIGAAVVWLGRREIKGTVLNELLFMAGLVMIAVAVFAFDKDTLFPAYNALLPCVGAGLVIYAGGRAPLCSKILNNKAMVWIGLISYSLYLIHWPVHIYYRLWTGVESYALADLAIVSGLTFVLAAAMYQFVEKPFRLRRSSGEKYWSPKAFLLSCGAVILVLTCLFYQVWTGGGWKWRYPDITVHPNIDRSAIDTLYTEDEKRMNALAFDKASAKPALLIMGDSHSTDFANSVRLSDLSDAYQISRMTVDEIECSQIFLDALGRLEPGEDCESFSENALSDERFAQADHVLLVERWRLAQMDDLRAFLGALDPGLRNKIVLVNRTAEFKDVPYLLYQYGRTDGFNAYLYDKRVEKIGPINAALEEVAQEYAVPVIDKNGLVCSEQAESCLGVLDTGEVAIWDYGHWTYEGARYFGNAMDEQGVIDEAVRR